MECEPEPLSDSMPLLEVNITDENENGESVVSKPKAGPSESQAESKPPETEEPKTHDHAIVTAVKSKPHLQCVNCDTVFTKQNLRITEIEVGYCEEEEEDKVDDCSKMYLVDALSSVFSPETDRQQASRDELREAGFCVKCAKIASQLYGHFNTLLNFSTPTAPISELIPQFKNFHTKHPKTESTIVSQNGTEAEAEQSESKEEVPDQNTSSVSEVPEDKLEESAVEEPSNNLELSTNSEVEVEETQMEVVASEVTASVDCVEIEKQEEPKNGREGDDDDTEDETIEKKDDEPKNDGDNEVDDEATEPKAEDEEKEKEASATDEEEAVGVVTTSPVVIELRKSARDRKKSQRFGEDMEVTPIVGARTKSQQNQATKRGNAGDDSVVVPKKTDSSRTPSPVKAKSPQRKSTANTNSASKRRKRRR